MEEATNTSNSNENQLNKVKQIPYTCNIIPIRTALGLSQSDLAREIGTTDSFICMVEHLKYYPTLTMRIKIAKALNTDTSAIWIPINEKEYILKCKELIKELIQKGIDPNRAKERYSEKIYEEAKKEALDIIENGK